MKECPYCNNPISETAIRCKFCRKVLSEIQKEEPRLHQYFRGVVSRISRILRYIITLFLVTFIIMCILLFFILVFRFLPVDSRRDIMDFIKGIPLWAWVCLVYIFFLFDLVVRKREHFEEDIEDVCCYSGAPMDYGDLVDGKLEICNEVRFSPYKNTVKPFVIAKEDITMVRTRETDLKNFSILGQWAAVRNAMLAAFVSQNYLYISYKTPSGEKTVIFKTHRKSRQNKILKENIEKLIKDSS